MTLFPEPGPPVTMTTCLVLALRARSTARITIENATCCWSIRTNCSRSRISSAASAINCLLGLMAGVRRASAACCRARRKHGAKEADELTASLSGEHPSCFALGVVPQSCNAVVVCVVQDRQHLPDDPSYH